MSNYQIAGNYFKTDWSIFSFYWKIKLYFLYFVKQSCTFALFSC